MPSAAGSRLGAGLRLGESGRASAATRVGGVERATLEWFELLARALIWAAGIVLVLAVIGSIAVVTSNTSLPFFEDLQRESRGIAAIGALAGGVAAAGALSGLGAILRLMVVDRLERLGDGSAAIPETERGGSVG
jgi:hypothetical protein